METIIRKEKRDIRACQAFTANTDCFFTIHESLDIRREERCPTSFPWYCFVFHKTVVERVPPTKRPDLNRKMAPGMFRKSDSSSDVLVAGSPEEKLRIVDISTVAECGRKMQSFKKCQK